LPFSERCDNRSEYEVKVLCKYWKAVGVAEMSKFCSARVSSEVFSLSPRQRFKIPENRSLQ
jgi:hypothetical protein